MATYKIIGYGSLLCHVSLKKTISDREFKPVMVKGYQRIFNVQAKNHNDLLNVIKRRGYYFNAVLFQVNQSELAKIKQREIPEYSLRQTWAHDFKTGKKIALAKLAVDIHKFIDFRKHQPNRFYFNCCREAAYAISHKFGQVWDKTTYTADGQNVSQWLKHNNIKLTTKF